MESSVFVGEELELRGETTPARPSTLDGTQRFGLARAAELVPDEPPPEAPPARSLLARRREPGPFMTYLCLPWSYGERDSFARWHRLRCRLGRHDVVGGHVMQLGGDDVFVERQCRWCGAAAG